MPTPCATYRVQLNAGFTFQDAKRAVPYLANLGISHLYTSPLLKARPGSMHGYDVIDHTLLNPELGTPEDFDRLIETLQAHGMGLIVDIVPNHLGVMGNDNRWWLDVLENGPVAQFAPYFDIDWRPNRASLRDRLLVPVLGDPYGVVLERGELKLHFDAARGEFHLCYYEHRFPVDPREYPRIFVDRNPSSLDDETAADLESLLSAFGRLPTRNVVNDEARAERYRDKEAHKRRLARLIERSPEVLDYITAATAATNGVVGVPASFDALDALLEAQAYRLAYWRVAADEINYRRFFDVNNLAALRMNDPGVFSATHDFLGGLIAAGKIDGLRVDHCDGLYDPEGYFTALRQYVAKSADAGTDSGASFYIVTEKILAQHERLPESWDVQGTTGYEFGALAISWLVDAASERALTRIYQYFTAAAQTFEEIAYDARKLVMRISLAPEVEGLATQLDRFAQLDRHTADFTRSALREAIIEVIACFPVYRTYISDRGHSEQDERAITWAVTVARKRSLAADVSVFDFLREMLLVNPVRDVPAARRVAMREFAMKFQQVTAPVTAKGVEDTALYRYNRLVCLNEVGSDPRRFGVSAQAVHQENAERVRRWPLCMLATSTHDTKRSEDVRANIAVLSELPDQWRRHLARWSRLNRSKRRLVNDAAAPDRQDEYLIYQTLIGLWASGTAVTATANGLSERLQEYIVKAAREAKRSTSWLNPDEQYEAALRSFVASLLQSPGRSAFLHDFEKLASTISWFGFLNSLCQVVLKIASPGVADIYQGSESPVFALVDPDNRRSVDFEAARQRLASLEQRINQGSGTLQQGMNWASRTQLLRDFVTAGYAGEGKLYVTYLMLKLRREHPQLFSRGSYEPLTVSGERKEHVLAFARVWESERVVVIVARWACKLLGGMRPASSDGGSTNGPKANDVWGNVWAHTHVELYKAWPAEPLTDLFSTRTIHIQMDPPCIAVAEVLASLPVAVLTLSPVASYPAPSSEERGLG